MCVFFIFLIHTARTWVQAYVHGVYACMVCMHALRAVYIRVCMCVYERKYARTYIHTYIHIEIYMIYIYIHMYVRTYIST